MYRDFYGLSEDPFQLNTDPRFFYMSAFHREAYAHMVYSLKEAKGFTVITGEIGTGKTSLIQLMMSRLDGRTHAVHIYNPRLSGLDFLQQICRRLGLAAEGLTKGELLEGLNDFLRRCQALGERVVVIVDDAQALQPDLLEEVRLLTNMETERGKLLQVILVGQPELDKTLAAPQNRPLAQRVSVHYHLNALNLNETGEYIRHRLKVAGAGDADIFEPAAVQRIWEFSGGIPRVVNTLCDNALVIGHSLSRKSIDRHIAEEAIQDACYLKPEADRPARRPAVLYVAAGTLLAFALALGAFAALKPYLPRPAAVEKAAAPAPAPVREEPTLALLARQHYGVANPTVLGILLDHNPQITDLNNIPAGEPINVPPLSDEQFVVRDPDGTYHIYLGSFDDQKDIEALWKHPLLQDKTLKTAFRRVSSGVFWYRLTLGGFPSKESALQVFQSLKQQGALPAFAASPPKGPAGG